jgi:hypothetical protein
MPVTTAFPTEETMVKQETAYPTEEKVSSSLYPSTTVASIDVGDDFKLDLDLDSLNITSEEIDFDEIDDDLERFQEDDMVKSALQRGVDLRKYAQELAEQLKEVCI